MQTDGGIWAGVVGVTGVLAYFAVILSHFWAIHLLENPHSYYFSHSFDSAHSFRLDTQLSTVQGRVV